MRLGIMVAFAVPAAGLAILMAAGRSVSAPPVDEAAAHRCASRLSLSLTGKSPDAALFANADPQSQIDTLLESPEFVEQFSTFMNEQLNPEPGETPQRDATYYLSRYVLQNGHREHPLSIRCPR